MKKLFSRLWQSFRKTISHYGWLTLIIIPILGLINWSYFSVVNSEKESLMAQQISIANEKVNIIDFIVATVVVNTYTDMHVITDADEMQMYLDDPSIVNLNNVEQLFYRIVNNKPQFSSVEFIDLTGQQLIWLDRIEENLVIVEEENLISRADKEYLEVADSLVQDELYIVPIYLLSETVDDTTVEKPITSLVLSVYNETSVKKGYLIIDYDANFFLNFFGEYVSDDVPFLELGLINGEEIWGITDKFDELYTAYNDPNLDYVIQNNVQLSNILDQNARNEDDFFQIYAIIDFQGVFDYYGGIGVKYPITVVIVNLVSLIIIFLAATFLKNKSNDRILLNANMYLSDKNNDGVLITNEFSEITYANQAFEEIYGFKLENIKGQKPNKILGHLNHNLKGLIIKSRQMFSKNIWNKNARGIYILKHLRIKPETNANGNIKHFLAIYSQPQIQIDSLTFASDFDAIETYKLFAKAFEEEELIVNKSCVMVIRTFNEKSRKLYTSLSKTNLSPLAFSEFLNSNLGQDYKIAVPAENYTIIYVSFDKIDQTFEETVDLIDNLIEKYKHQPNINSTLEYNFGIALADNKTITKADVIENAFIALQMSKAKKNIKHLIYSEETKKIIKREKDIYSQLEHGFNFDEFFLNYQIQKDLKKNSFTGVEALLRWNNGLLGSVSPVEFISIIENSFFINRLSLMVMNKVIKDFTPFVEYINPDFRISINLTYFDFFNEYIIHNLIDLIEKSPISSKNFCFEITESGYLENKEKTNGIIDFLHSKNITVAIDDFGTGFSSLEVLKNIHVDKIKIDRSFIKDYPKKDNGAIFKTIVNLVKTMNLEILVEGTETKEQVDFALENGCDEIQGYYISKPIHIENLVRQYLNKKSDF
jgi:PAS domain S-box-containing protein